MPRITLVASTLNVELAEPILTATPKDHQENDKLLTALMWSY